MISWAAEAGRYPHLGLTPLVKEPKHFQDDAEKFRQGSYEISQLSYEFYYRWTPHSITPFRGEPQAASHDVLCASP